jgi:hypothetical protein
MDSNLRARRELIGDKELDILEKMIALIARPRRRRRVSEELTAIVREAVGADRLARHPHKVKPIRTVQEAHDVLFAFVLAALAIQRALDRSARHLSGCA